MWVDALVRSTGGDPSCLCLAQANRDVSAMGAQAKKGRERTTTEVLQQAPEIQHLHGFPVHSVRPRLFRFGRLLRRPDDAVALALVRTRR